MYILLFISPPAAFWSASSPSYQGGVLLARMINLLVGVNYDQVN